MVMVTRQSITSPGYFCKVSESMTLNNRDEALLQASKLGLRIMRYELTDDEWFAIRSMLPNKAARCASRKRPLKRVF
jgi:hypothetical protein